MKISNKPLKILGIIYTIPFFLLFLFSSIPYLYQPHIIHNLYTVDRIILAMPKFIEIIIILSMILIIVYLYYYIKIHHNKEVLSFFILLTALFAPFGDYMLIPVIGLFITVFYNPISRKNILTKFDRIDYLWLAFVLAASISSSFAQYDKASALGMSFAFFGYGLIFKIIRYAQFSKKILKPAILLLAWVILTTVSFALFQLFINKDILIYGINLAPNGGPGLASIFSAWPANTAGFLVMSFCVLLYSLIQYYHKLSSAQKIIIITSTLICFIGLIATETRMALLFLGGFFGAFLLCYPFERFKKLRFVIIVIPVLLVPILFMSSQKWKDTFTKPLQQQTIVERVHQYQYGLELFSDNNPLIGVGIMNFRQYYNQFGNPITKVQFLHNIYLSMLVESGIIGLILFLLAIGNLILFYWKYIPRLEAYFGLYFIAGLLAVNLVDAWFFVLRFSILLFLVLGFITNRLEQTPPKENKEL